MITDMLKIHGLNLNPNPRRINGTWKSMSRDSNRLGENGEALAYKFSGIA